MNIIETTQELREALRGGPLNTVEFPPNVNLLWFDEPPTESDVNSFEELGVASGRSVHLR